MEELKEGELVLCTVTSIVKTTVFVRIEDNGEGSIITSEIAPGRIRNLRDYVSPGRKIVCKVLKIQGENINLSLRRVSLKEKNEVLEKYERERNALSILKTVLQSEAEKVAGKIKKQSLLYEFLQNCKINPEKLEEYMKKEEAERICKILSEKKEKKVEVKKEFLLSSKKPDGIKLIKEILSSCKVCEIIYIAAGKFVIKIKADDYKSANNEINKALAEFESQAKQKKVEFETSKS